MAELRNQLDVIEDRIWDMEMGTIDGRNIFEYQRLLAERGRLRRAIREAEQ